MALQRAERGAVQQTGRPGLHRATLSVPDLRATGCGAVRHVHRRRNDVAPTGLPLLPGKRRSDSGAGPEPAPSGPRLDRRRADHAVAAGPGEPGHDAAGPGRVSDRLRVADIASYLADNDWQLRPGS